jgi:hypothetical protein
MRRIVVAAAVLGLGLALAGCGPGQEPVDPPSSVVPTLAPPSEEVTPTPQWTEVEQGAIDAVQAYLEVSFDIGRHLDAPKYDLIYDVAGQPLVDESIARWNRWKESGWHEDGAPSFDTTSVSTGMADGSGKRFHVTGCLVDSYLVDAEGVRLFPTALERFTVNYLVLHSTDGYFVVLDDPTEREPC